MNQGRTYNYMILRFVRDELSNDSAPFGIAYWADDPRQVQFRLVVDGESLPFKSTDLDVFSPRFRRQLESYLTKGELPYFAGEPYTEAWWAHLRSLLIHRFRLEGPRQLEIFNADLDFDLQFSAIVRPIATEHRDDVRIDSWVATALGKYSDEFKKAAVPGFEGRPVDVLKVAQRGNDIIVVDAVNLTRSDAKTELEAMLMRAYELKNLRPPSSDGNIHLILGYYSSPSGLNGEASLVRMGEKLFGEALLDLRTDTQTLERAIELDFANAGR